MTAKVMDCPACSRPLPPETRPNELVTCPACHSTLYLSDWEIGKNNDAVLVATPTRVYTVTDLVGNDDLTNSYRCAYKADDKTWQGMFRLARRAGDNDLVKTEAQTLYALQTTSGYDEYRPFLPLVLESFLYHDASGGKAKHVNIMGLHEQINAPNELYTLEEIHNYYPNGIDPKDMAWMWRRLLFIMGFVHDAGVIHGAVLPNTVLIEPKDHKLVLSGWGFSVRDVKQTGNHLTAVSETYDKWYPDEVFQKQTPLPGLDLMMAARCMMYLIGADPLSKPKHRNLESDMAQYFARCMVDNPAARPQKAWTLLEEFDTLIEKMWGPRTFRVFTMPYKA